MPTAFWGVGAASCLALAAGAALAQEAKPIAAQPRPTVQALTIINGPTVTHSYYIDRGSPHLEARYKELELAENEMTLAFDLGRLKLDYVQNERLMDNLRVSHFQFGLPGGYYGCCGNGICGDFPTGDLLIKSRIAPQLGQAATYENGVKAIRIWERAKVEALKTLQEESGAGVGSPPRLQGLSPTQAPPPRPIPAFPQSEASDGNAWQKTCQATTNTWPAVRRTNAAALASGEGVSSSNATKRPRPLASASLLAPRLAPDAPPASYARSVKPLVTLTPVAKSGELRGPAKKDLRWLASFATVVAVCLGLGMRRRSWFLPSSLFTKSVAYALGSVSGRFKAVQPGR